MKTASFHTTARKAILATLQTNRDDLRVHDTREWRFLTDEEFRRLGHAKPSDVSYAGDLDDYGMFDGAWRAAVDAALEVSRERVFIVQRYRKPMVLEHPVFDAQGAVAPMPSRLRLCPYFMVQGADARLAGALATFCPADKKIIHGMRDAALVPLASG